MEWNVWLSAFHYKDDIILIQLYTADIAQVQYPNHYQVVQISSASRQKVLTTSQLYTQWDPFTLKLMIYTKTFEQSRYGATLLFTQQNHSYRSLQYIHRTERPTYLNKFIRQLERRGFKP